MTAHVKVAVAVAVASGVLLAPPLQGQSKTSPNKVSFYGPPAAIISAGVVLPPGHAVVWTSGTTPPALRPDLKAGDRERYGDTKAQASGILKAIEAQLVSQGLTMKDVVYIRAYLVPDPMKDGKIDVAGWNAAYSDVFGTPVNPIKPARSTVGVVALVNSDFLIEIEAFAAFPAP